MDLLRLSAKEMGIDISKHQLEMFQVYYHELITWNSRVNLTAITNYEDVQIKHFLDSLTLIPYLDRTNTMKVIDIGSGGGFPGVPLKIIRPDIDLTLIESTAKKTKFLNHLIGALKLDGTDVICGRAEEKAFEAVFREQYDIALTRAIGVLSTNLELSLPFCKVSGLSVSYKKNAIKDELDSAKHAAPILGGQFDRVEPVSRDLFPDRRVLVFFRKVSPTPSKYPRNIGIPSKRPL